MSEQRNETARRFDYTVIDYTTNNLLGEFDTEWEAEGYVNRITPHGRYGPMGHDIRIEKRENEHD